MSTYTADAVSLLVYLVDALPGKADQIFAEAEAAKTVIQAPSTALAEVLYSVSRDKTSEALPLQERQRMLERRWLETDLSLLHQSTTRNWLSTRRWWTSSASTTP
ncbi:hypothetical protein [Halococcus sediminicola]|uniref:hypothetical protein n=1 Tax=Halococcus sediminicola TaxID=1264579 RepID=UPI001F424ACF|nr:hypothetical protein [Halococcus sediminicola]